MRGTDPRRLAAQVLAAVEDGQWSDEVLARALGESGLGDNDRGLVTRIVYGTIAHQRTLDHTLAALDAMHAANFVQVVDGHRHQGKFALFTAGEVGFAAQLLLEMRAVVQA